MNKYFSGTLAKHLDIGHVLQFAIKARNDASNCSISLLTSKLSENPDADVGLNFTVYFHENAIGRNRRIHGNWGQEERHTENRTLPQNPIKAGQFFQLSILCAGNGFYITINNRHVCTFDYRLPVNALKAVEIHDQIEAIKQVDHRIVYPYPLPPILSTNNSEDCSFVSPLAFKPGYVLSITAYCSGNKKGQFIIKFMDAETKREDLHFNARFAQKMVVRNSMNNAYEFGTEERYGGFPFAINRQFKLDILFTNREFVFTVDGEHFTNYAYRRIDVLQKLVGFNLTTKDDLEMHICGIDHQ